MAIGTRKTIGLALLIPLNALPLLAGCGGSGLNRAGLDEPGQGSQAALGELATPAGVEAGLWEELKQTLSTELARYTAASHTIAAPQNEANKIRDFEAELVAGEIHFSWSYRNVGDYDRNGEVNASDLVPLAQHFGAVEGQLDWEPARIADGDENGEVNLGDVTPIAANFNNSVAGYRLEATVYTSSNWWPDQGQIALGDAEFGAVVPRFTYVLETPEPRDWYRVRPQVEVDRGVDMGIASDPLQIVLDPDTPPDPPIFLSASDGDSSGSVTLNWIPPANATSYLIYRDSQQQWLAELEAVTTWEDTTLDDTQPHTYWVRAANAFGASDFSEPDTGSLPFGGGAPGQGEWWTYAHDRQRTGRSEFTVPDAPQLLWAYEAGSLPTSPVFGRDGTIYFATQAGRIFAVNPDATTRWVTDIGSGTNCDLTLSEDGVLYIGSYADFGRSILHALDTNGDVLWRFARTEQLGQVLGAPLVAPDGTIYFGDTRGEFYRLDPSGNLLGKFEETDPSVTGRMYRGAPAMAADGSVYASATDGRVYAMDAELRRKWFFPTQSYFDNGPVVGDDGTVFISSGYGDIYAINPDGTLRWKSIADYGGNDQVVVGAGGTIYSANFTGEIHAFTPDGQLLWSRDSGGNGGLAVDATGTLFFVSGHYELRALTPAGEDKWSQPVGKFTYQSPVIDSSGRIYVGAGTQLLCYGAAMELPAPPAHAPENVQASDEEFTDYVVVTWDKVPGATNYRVYRDDVDIYGHVRGKEVVATVYNSDRWTDTGLGKAKDFRLRMYWVSATNPYGESQLSEPDTGSLGRLPADPGPGGWSREGNGPKLQRQSPATGPPTDYQKNWTNELSDGTSSYTFSEPVVGSEGRIYVATSSGWLIVINPNGTYHWKVFLGGDSAGSVAVGDDGRVIVGMDQGMIVVVDRSGDPLWQYTSGLDEYMAITLADDGTIYATTTLGNLYSISPAGEHNWVFEGSGETYWPPAVDDAGTIYFAIEDDHLYAVNPDGSERWRFAPVWDRPHVAVGASGDILLRDGRYLSALQPDGKLDWVEQLPTPDAEAPAVGADGRIYLGGNFGQGFNTGGLLAYSPSGELLWSYEVPGPLSPPVVDGKGNIYLIAGSRGVVYALDSDGNEMWHWGTYWEVNWPGTLSLGDDGTLYQLRGFTELNAFGPRS